MATNPHLLTLPEAAKLLGVSESTGRNLINRRQLKAVILPSGHRRIPMSEISRFLRVECAGKAKVSKAGELAFKA